MRVVRVRVVRARVVRARVVRARVVRVRVRHDVAPLTAPVEPFPGVLSSCPDWVEVFFRKMTSKEDMRARVPLVGLE